MFVFGKPGIVVGGVAIKTSAPYAIVNLDAERRLRWHHEIECNGDLRTVMHPDGDVAIACTDLPKSSSVPRVGFFVKRYSS